MIASDFFSCESTLGSLPLERLEVRTRIVDHVAATSVVQSFVHGYRSAIEAIYTFPLPPEAAVTRFALRVGERQFEGRVSERGAARAAYDQASDDGRFAAIIEEDRVDVFTVRVGPIAPGERFEVTLELVGPLAILDGEAIWRFPLVVAPRYVPGTPLAGPASGTGTTSDTDQVPDASRVNPPRLANGARGFALDFEVAIAGPGVTDKLELSHPAARTEDPRWTVLRLPADTRADRDVILRFPVIKPAFAAQLVLVQDADAAACAGVPTGTWQLTLTPPAEAGSLTRPRDFVFALDRSASMEGPNIACAREALARLVESLGREDRLAVFTFDNEPEGLGAKAGHALVPADRAQLAELAKALRAVQPGGGTEMSALFAHAARLLGTADPRRERLFVLVTDGQVANEDELVAYHQAEMPDVRVLALGIGPEVARGLLERLAARSGGSCELIAAASDITRTLTGLQRRLAPPVLTVEDLAWNGVEAIAEASSVALPVAIYAGKPMQLRGRYLGTGPASVAVRCATPTGPVQHEVSGRPLDFPPLRALWARERVRALEDAFLAQPSDARERELVATSERFGVLSRFTAFTAIESVTQVGHRKRVPARTSVTQPVAAPASSWGRPSDGRARTITSTRAGSFGSAARFMSPEEARGRSFTSASVTWSLAAFLVELARGEALFKRESDFQTLMAILNGPIPEPLWPGAPASLEASLRACLNRAETDRPRVAELHGELRAALGGVEPAAVIRAWLTPDRVPIVGHLDQFLKRVAALVPLTAPRAPDFHALTESATWGNGIIDLSLLGAAEVDGAVSLVTVHTQNPHDGDEDAAWLAGLRPLDPMGTTRYLGQSYVPNGLPCHVERWQPEVSLADVVKDVPGPLPMVVVCAIGASLAGLLMAARTNHHERGVSRALEQVAIGRDGSLRLTPWGPLPWKVFAAYPTATPKGDPRAPVIPTTPIPAAPVTARVAPDPAPRPVFWKRWFGRPGG